MLPITAAHISATIIRRDSSIYILFSVKIKNYSGKFGAPQSGQYEYDFGYAL